MPLPIAPPHDLPGSPAPEPAAPVAAARVLPTPTGRTSRVVSRYFSRDKSAYTLRKQVYTRVNIFSETTRGHAYTPVVRALEDGPPHCTCCCAEQHCPHCVSPTSLILGAFANNAYNVNVFDAFNVSLGGVGATESPVTFTDDGDNDGDTENVTYGLVDPYLNLARCHRRGVPLFSPNGAVKNFGGSCYESETCQWEHNEAILVSGPNGVRPIHVLSQMWISAGPTLGLRAEGVLVESGVVGGQTALIRLFRMAGAEATVLGGYCHNPNAIYDLAGIGPYAEAAPSITTACPEGFLNRFGTNATPVTYTADVALVSGATATIVPCCPPCPQCDTMLPTLPSTVAVTLRQGGWEPAANYGDCVVDGGAFTLTQQLDEDGEPLCYYAGDFTWTCTETVAGVPTPVTRNGHATLAYLSAAFGTTAGPADAHARWVLIARVFETGESDVSSSGFHEARSYARECEGGLLGPYYPLSTNLEDAAKDLPRFAVVA